MSERFDDEALRAAYGPKLRERAPRGADCPEPEAMLAALRGEGPEPERLRVLDHALACAACRPELAMLRLASAPVTRAAGARQFPLRAISWLAAAATLVLAVGIIGLGRWRQASTDVTRSGGSNVPVLIAPGGETVTRETGTEFVWHAFPNALRYTLEVDAPDGTVLYSGESADTTITTGPAAFPPGVHRWWIRVRLDDGSERRSETRALRVN